MSKKISLPNGCSFSYSVHPANWKSSRASVKEDWYIHYRFYEPGVKPKRIGFKGMNEFHTLPERQQITEQLLNDEISALRSGYNPNKKSYTREAAAGDISPDDTLEFALNYALSKIRIEKTTHTAIKSSLNSFLKGATVLHYNTMPVSQIRRKHVLDVLEKCEQINKRFTDYSFNRYRKDVSILFKELVKREAIEFNPVDEFLEPRKVTKKIPEILNNEQRKQIDKYLYENNFTFWRFIQIYFHSAARISELMLLKVKEIDLQSQYYKIIVKKGKQRIERRKIIKNIALPFWKNLLMNAKDDDYIFSKDLKPGIIPINPHQLSRRWNVHVIKKLGINVKLNKLKHLNTTEISELLSQEHAAKLNSHTTTAMVKSIYDVRNKQREDDELKKVGNKFSG